VLLLAGDGPNRAAIEALRSDLDLGERVRVLGVRSDIPRLLAAADLTTLSSDWEGLPVAVLESMASARAVVATSVDGVAEVLQFGGGLLVPPRDPAALAEALNTLLGDRQEAAAVGLRAAEVVSAHHNPVDMIHSYDRLLRRLTSQKETRAE
jgi:glycosyltransferase involved in cell wall biosynthesis